MKKESFYIPSSDGSSRIYCAAWLPEGTVRAVLQITHGMVEYIERYEPLARVLADDGIAVIGHDHLGHGKTAGGEENLGFFAEKDGAKVLIKDIHRVTKVIQKRYPDLPCFLMGHSMGSFYARRYITIYGDELDGAIFMGTGWVPGYLACAGMLLSGIICKLKGGRYRSKLLVNMTLGSYNRMFRKEGLPNAWLSREKAAVEAYNQDPLCQFSFTASAYHDFFTVMKELADEKQFGRIPKDLPVWFLSGDQDPVGNMGAGVEKACGQLEALGLKEVDLTLYADDRHELVNETDREQVYEDIRQWLNRHIGGRQAGTNQA